MNDTMTNDWRDFLYNLEKLNQSCDCFLGGDEREIKWICIHLYDSLVGAFVASLCHGNPYAIWKSKCKYQGIAFSLDHSLETGTAKQRGESAVHIGTHGGTHDKQIEAINSLPCIKDKQIDKRDYGKIWGEFQMILKFDELYKRCKARRDERTNQIVNSRYMRSMLDMKSIPKDLQSEADETLQRLRNTRNNFVHFGRKIWGIKWGYWENTLPPSAKVLNFLVNESNAFSHESHFKSAQQMTNQVSKKIGQIFQE